MIKKIKYYLLICLFATLSISANAQFIGIPNFDDSSSWLTSTGVGYTPWVKLDSSTVKTYVVGQNKSELWIDAPNHYNSEGRPLPHKVTWSHSNNWRGTGGYLKFRCPGWDVNTQSVYEKLSFVILPQYPSSTIKLTWYGYNTHDYLYWVQYETLNPPTPSVYYKYTPRGGMYVVTWSPMMHQGQKLWFKLTANSPYQEAVNCYPPYNALTYSMSFMTSQPITFYLHSNVNTIYTLIPEE
jgi:hypothetical protein